MIHYLFILKHVIIEPEILQYIDSFIPEVSRKQRNAIIFKLGESVSIRNIDDNINDDFFELQLNDIKLLHSQNVRDAKEAQEGEQVNTWARL